MSRAETSTLPEPIGVERLKRARAGRRAVIAIMALLLLLALSTLLGVRTSEKAASAEGYDVTVTYASVTRPGLATPFDVEVTKAGGFDEPVVLAVSGDFLAAFDENGLDPDPASSVADADFTYWRFDPPPGDTLGVSFDARLEPAVQWKREGTVKLLAERTSVVEIDFTMWVMP